MSAKILYQIVGRYMDGNEVTRYRLQRNDGKICRYTIEQVYYLVGRGQVRNCMGQFYNGEIILKGIGVNLDRLPVYKDPEIQFNIKSKNNTPSVVLKNNTPDTSDRGLITILNPVIEHYKLVKYIVKTADGETIILPKDKVIELAKAGKVSNACCQLVKGKLELRGLGIDLNQLKPINLL